MKINETKQKIVIIGAGGHGRVMLDVLQKQNTVKIVGFVDDNPQLKNQQIHGVQVIGTTADLPIFAASGIEGFLVALGNNTVRAEKYLEALAAGLQPISAIHPSAIIANNVSLGPGVQIVAGVIVNPGTYIGANVILNTGCSVDHDCLLEDHCFIAPGVRLGGSVQVGEGAFIGIGATVLPNKKIGEWATVGAGAVVTRDVPPRTVVMGIPAKPKNSSNNV